jgi:hypothetical protein
MNQDAIPEDMQRALIMALQDISLYVHNLAGQSQVIMNVNHISDAINRNGSTSIAINVGGVRCKRDADEEPKKPAAPPVEGKPEELASQVINEMMKKAKDKEG